MFERAIRIFFASVCLVSVVFFLDGCGETQREDHKVEAQDAGYTATQDADDRAKTKAKAGYEGMLQPPEGPDRPVPPSVEDK